MTEKPANKPQWERWMASAIWCGIGLVVLTPLVILPTTMYPFVVGKALWSRSIIATVFALWVVLALLRPAYRPPRSRLLVLLGLGVVVAGVSAAFGVSPVRSVWSTYARMNGVLDLAHWFAFTVVLAAMVRELGDLVRLLKLLVGVGVAASLIALASWQQMALPWVGVLTEVALPRIGGSFGNPIFLGAFLVVCGLLAGGFLFRSFASTEDAPPEGSSGRDERRGRTKRQERRRAARKPPRPPRRWPARIGWGVVLYFCVLGIVLSASVGAIAAAVGGAGFLVALNLKFLRGPALRGLARRILLAGAGAALLATAVLAVPGASGGLFSNPLADRVRERASAAAVSLGGRVVGWEAGLRGFADRPLLGYGPENFVVPFGQYSEAGVAAGETFDRSHNLLVDEAAMTGVLGLLLQLALWGYALWTLVRAARSGAAGGVLVQFVGAALFALFIALQASFFTAATSMAFAVLCAFVVYCEPRRERSAAGGVRSGWKRAVGVVIALGAVGLAGATLTANRSIYRAAFEIRGALEATEAPPGMRHLERAIAAFPPMANTPRRMFMDTISSQWPYFRNTSASSQRHLGDEVDRHAVAVMETEPLNWELHGSVAMAYTTMAANHPRFVAPGERWVASGLRLSPRRHPLGIE